jgi:ubiquinone/menaquinone biosynthesis C-methylase UbiE
MRRFFAANTRASHRVAAALGLESDKPFWDAFEQTAADKLRGLPSGSTVLDLGGGRRSVYAKALAEANPLRLVAVDVSPEELALNQDVEETCVADVADELPFADASIDLILSRAALEHVDGVPAAARNMARVLRPGGAALHFVPCRYSLFGIAARLLAFGPLLRVLHAVDPESRGQTEFEVCYDHCYPSAIRDVFSEAGFREVSIEVCWAQPGYFEPVFPLFLLTSAYEFMVRRLRITGLAAYMIVSAVR